MNASRVLRSCVFLDRDGTINREVDYLSEPEQVKLIAGAARALERLAAAGYALVVITNQSGIARGLIAEERLPLIHARLDELLTDELLADELADASRADRGSIGARAAPLIERYYHCPHHPEYGEPPYRRACRCRKPGPELLERAAYELQLDLTRSYMVGDSLRDLDAAAALGVPGILVRTGKGLEQERLARAAKRKPTVVDDLAGAADRILGRSARRASL